ncbi:sugar phosphate nucleotidyltransferase [Candidatus Margulisiibacteriota bacterium]
MQAIILAGGKGTRLKPYTTIFPKPLVPVGDIPILEIVIRQLKHHGFKKITIAVGHLAELIEAFFGDGKKWGVEISYSLEDKPLGTAGPIALVDDLENDFLIMNGDLLTSINFKDLMEKHKKNKAISTISIYKKDHKIELGILELDKDNNLTDYIEKPTKTYPVSMGIYIFNKKILGYIPKNKHLDLPDLIKTLISKKEKIHGYLFKDKWLDIGQEKDYLNAIEEFNIHRKLFLKDEK